MVSHKIPYGFSNYKEIRTGKYLYVDKTKYIEELERLNSKYLVLLRPRRFGKSLFVSMLHYYYDRKSAVDFQQLFGDTYIGNHKTASANTYYILRLEFSGLDGRSEEHLRNAFYAKVHAAIRSFVAYYGEEIRIMENKMADSAMLLNYFLSDLDAAGKKLYILIDEYDHFATNIIENPDFFSSVTGRDGFVRRFYEVLKDHTGTGCVDRMFITGVTSMTLDSLTSGFNISKNISMDPRANGMAGFTEAETRKMLDDLGLTDADGIMERLIAYYNGYVFCHDPEQAKRILNSSLVMYFLDEYMSSNQNGPRQMADANIRSDYGKLTNMFGLYRDVESRTEILRSIIEGKPAESDIVTDFSMFSDTFGRDEFLSMLFYMGLLTIKGPGTVYDVVLETPNAVIRDVYYKYYADYLKIEKTEKRDAVRQIAHHDDFTELNRLIERILRTHSNEDFKAFDEHRLKTAILSCFSDQNIYLVKSEYESGGRRPDIALLDFRGENSQVPFHYLIELKYLKKSDASEHAVEKARKEAYSQMQEYLKLEEFARDDRMKGVIYIVVKDKIRCFEKVAVSGCGFQEVL